VARPVSLLARCSITLATTCCFAFSCSVLVKTGLADETIYEHAKCHWDSWTGKCPSPGDSLQLLL
jgi:hypothetical protein